SAQGLKSPLIRSPKPPGTFRVMCYGDSNTDGLSVGRAWPTQLQGFLARDHGSNGAVNYEVVNAGVVGYSSYQGLCGSAKRSIDTLLTWFSSRSGGSPLRKPLDHPTRSSQAPVFCRISRPAYYFSAASSCATDWIWSLCTGYISLPRMQ